MFFFEKKANHCLSIAPQTPMQTRNMEWANGMSGCGAPLFVGIQLFELSASNVNCTRHIAIYGSRAQLCVISNPPAS